MKDDLYWSVLIYFLHAYEIYMPFEKYLKENNLLSKKSSVTSLPNEQLVEYLLIFLNQSNSIDLTNKEKMLEYLSLI